MNTTVDRESQDKEVKENHKRFVEQIVEHFDKLSEVVLFHDQMGDAFARIPSTSSFTTAKIRSKKFNSFLSHNVYKKWARPIPGDIREQVLAIFEAKAKYDGKCYPLNIRVGGSERNSI